MTTLAELLSLYDDICDFDPGIIEEDETLGDHVSVLMGTLYNGERTLEQARLAVRAMILAPTRDTIIEALASLSKAQDLTDIEGAARCRAHEIRSKEGLIGLYPETTNDTWFVKEARKQYQRDGEIEVDENATVSRGGDPGAYVQSWVWVDFPEQTVECASCGEEVPTSEVRYASDHPQEEPHCEDCMPEGVCRQNA